jgi:hypothetical protein
VQPIGERASARAVGGAIAAVLLCASTAVAQPAGVTVTDLGNFAGSASTVQTQNVTLTTAVPVVWFKIRLPRIAPPFRFLDISTSGTDASFDTELALYRADGGLIAADDDDGANNYSALSFGMTDLAVPGRVAPVAAPGQAAGALFDGRDGTLSGLASIEQGGTAGDYYIAVTQWNADFVNGFVINRLNGPASGLATLLTVRMGTPSGQVAPTVDGNDESSVVGGNSISVSAFVSANTTGASVDLSSIGGPSNQSMSLAGSQWIAPAVLLSSPLSQIAVFPMTFRASNAIGDVTIDVANVTVRPRGALCQNANESPIATTPGTIIYTYTTTLGTVDGPWTNACFTQTPTGNDVWFRFVPTQSGTLTLSTCNSDTGASGGQPDTLLGFRGRCFDAGFSVCGDDVGGCGLGTKLFNIPVTAGQEYNIAVRAFSTDIVDGRLAVTFTPTACNPSDVAGPNQSIGADGALTADDIIVFLGWFFNSDPRANVAGANQSTVPDNAFTADDIIVFLGRYFNGC